MYGIVGSSDSTKPIRSEVANYQNHEADDDSHYRQGLSDDEEKKDAVVLYGSLDELPQFKGGYKELCDYLSQTITIKTRSEEEKYFSVTFVVNRDGSINKFIDVKAMNPEIEQNLLPVIKNMPKWIPGKRNGNSVPVQVRFSFLLKEKLAFKTSMSPDIYRIEIND